MGSSAPEFIPDEELTAIRILVESTRPFENHCYITEGMWVEVVQGPLLGLRGQLIRQASHECLVISVRLIQQAAIVHIERSEVRALGSDVL